MRRFCRDSSVLNLHKPEKFFDLFSHVFHQLGHSNEQRGTLSDMVSTNLANVVKLSSRYYSIISIFFRVFFVFDGLRTETSASRNI